MIVSMYMSEDVATVDSRDDVASAASIMGRRGVRCVPVVDRGRLVGILSRSDVLRGSSDQTNPFSAEARARAMGRTVAEVMSSTVTTIAPDAAIDAAVQVLDDRHLSSLVVVDGDAIVGMLSRTDILRAFREVLCSDDAVRVSLIAGDDVDLSARALQGLSESGIELVAFAEHRKNGKRYVLVSLRGDTDSIHEWMDSAWSEGVRVLQVQRP